MSRGGPSDQLARLVHHALAGAPLVAPGEVATACLAAAQAARQRNAYRLAVQHCKDGRQLAEDPSHRFALLLELGDASRDAGELAESDAAYLEAEEFARTHSKPRWQALAALRLARRWWIPGRTDHELRQRLELALAALDEGAWELRAQLQAHIANALATGGGDVERRERLAAAALAVVDHCVDPLVRCEILTACWHGRYESRSPTELLTLSRRLKEASRETESIHFRGEGLVTNLVDLVRVGDFAEARQTLGEHRELAERTVQPRALYLQASMDGMMAMWRGDFVEVPVHLAAMAEHGELLHSDMVTQVQIAQYGWFQRELGRADELVRQEDAVRQAVGQSTDIPIWRAALALLLVETARYPDCYWVLNGILRDFDDLSAFPPHGWAVPTLALIAEVCEGLHRAHQADQAPFDLRRLLYELDELLAPHLGEVALAGWPAVLVGPIARYAGLVALALDKPSLAQERLLAAMPLVETSPPNRARVAFDLGRALLRDPANDRDAGRQFLDQARRQAEDLNMEQLATQAQTALTAT